VKNEMKSEKIEKTMQERAKELKNVFSDVSDGEKILVDHLIDEVVYLESRMQTLKELPQTQIVTKYKSTGEIIEGVKTTAAAKQYKECSQSYMNAIRILLNVLRKTDVEAGNELLKKLEEFQ
jgi:hypothetical protein